MDRSPSRRMRDRIRLHRWSSLWLFRVHSTALLSGLMHLVTVRGDEHDLEALSGEVLVVELGQLARRVGDMSL